MKRDKFGRFCSSFAKTIVKKNTSTVEPKTVLVLRTCNKNLQGYGGFQWPASGPVSCLDWNPKPVCGGGLHGLLNGVGDGDLLNWGDDAVWLVVEVIASEVVSIDDQKVKFPRGTVVFCGNRKDATDYIWERVPNGSVVVGASRIVGDNQTVAVGYGGTASAGEYGTASAGDYGTASAGYGGTISIKWYDNVNHRYRTTIGYVGENGIEANKKYKCNEVGQLVEVK